MGLRVIIAGDREITDIQDVINAVKKAGFEIDEVVCGDCRGADKLGDDWAKSQGIKVKHFPADWKDLKQPGAVIKERINPWTKKKEKYNANAGFYRNEQMAEYADAVIGIQTKGYSSGTADMVNKMKKKGKLHSVYHGEETYEFDFGCSQKMET